MESRVETVESYRLPIHGFDSLHARSRPDADSMSAKHVQAIFDEIAKFGEANVRRIYGDFSNGRLAGWDAAVQSLAILQHQRRSNSKGPRGISCAMPLICLDGHADGGDPSSLSLHVRLEPDPLKTSSKGFEETSGPQPLVQTEGERRYAA